jgi:hypothetical protein
MAGRFIKLYEKLLNWEWFRDSNTLQLFLYLLLKANYRTSTFQGVKVGRGQLVTSISKLGQATGQSVRQIRDNLKHLEMTGEVTSQSTNRYRIITVVRYDDYQSVDKQNDKQNDKQLDKQMTSQVTSQTATSIEYIENTERDRNIESLTRGKTTKRFVPPTREELLLFCQEAGIQIDVDRFLNYYTANGWMAGRNKMKDWKATARNWANRDQQKPAPVPVKKVPAASYEQRDYGSEDDLAYQRMIQEWRNG